MRGLDPRIHPLRKSLSKEMDCRIKPGSDGAWCLVRSRFCEAALRKGYALHRARETAAYGTSFFGIRGAGKGAKLMLSFSPCLKAGSAAFPRSEERRVGKE